VLGRHNPRLQRLRAIAAREDPMLTVLDGVALIADAARHGAAVQEVFGVAERLAELRRIPAIAALARAGRVFALDEATVQRLAPTRSSQGVLAVVEVRARPLPAGEVVVFLDDVQDPGNVGGIVRAAAAFSAAGVACSPACADPFSPRAVRASAGQSLMLPVLPGASFAPLAAAVRAAGGTVAAACGDAELALGHWRPARPVLVAFGNEGAGVSPAVLAECDVTVSIPIAAGVESLNVAVAAGIVLHALDTAPILKMRDTGRTE
jgi:RNA methyltransferase, TrmH family